MISTSYSHENAGIPDPPSEQIPLLARAHACLLRVCMFKHMQHIAIRHRTRAGIFTPGVDLRIAHAAKTGHHSTPHACTISFPPFTWPLVFSTWFFHAWNLTNLHIPRVCPQAKKPPVLSINQDRELYKVDTPHSHPALDSILATHIPKGKKYSFLHVKKHDLHARVW
jgi:hypothetical protein